MIKAIVGTSVPRRAGVWVCGLAMLGTLGIAAAQQAVPVPAASGAPTASPARYTFTWQLGQPDAPAPRGGTTRGPAVTLDNEPSKAWSALQGPGLSPYERDRRAILAMAGDYRVTFDFLEVDTFPPQTPRDKPYQSWGTERVYVDADSGKSISLVHILNMRIVQEDGSISEPMITKHWRQTWQYQPTGIVEYKGRDRWERRKLAPAENSGRWSQTVYQVDESPRYAGVGRWSHSSSFSTWISGDTWRPLPRREWSVRKDYQVLLGTNRHTITATGWVQEENNLKTVLTPERALDPARDCVPGRALRLQLAVHRDALFVVDQRFGVLPAAASVRARLSSAFASVRCSERG